MTDKHMALAEMARLIRTSGNAPRRPEPVWQIPRAFAQGTGAPSSQSTRTGRCSKLPPR